MKISLSNIYEENFVVFSNIFNTLTLELSSYYTGGSSSLYFVHTVECIVNFELFATLLNRSISILGDSMEEGDIQSIWQN